MTHLTRKLLEFVDSTPELIREIRHAQTQLRVSIKKAGGRPMPKDVFSLGGALARGNLFVLRLFKVLDQISDAQIRALLMVRASIGLPWEMLRHPDGTDAISACTAWLDEHESEILAALQNAFPEV